jgi:hypothetical protein
MSVGLADSVGNILQDLGMNLIVVGIEFLEAFDGVVQFVPGHGMAVCPVLVLCEQKKDVVEGLYKKEMFLQAVGLFDSRIYPELEHPLGHGIRLVKEVYMCRGGGGVKVFGFLMILDIIWAHLSTVIQSMGLKRR